MKNKCKKRKVFIKAGSCNLDNQYADFFNGLLQEIELEGKTKTREISINFGTDLIASRIGKGENLKFMSIGANKKQRKSEKKRQEIEKIAELERKIGILNEKLDLLKDFVTNIEESTIEFLKKFKNKL